MWKLLYSDGSIARDNLSDQWAALRISFKRDGSRYKKAEALQVKSGTVVYRNRAITKMFKYENILDDGSIGKSHTKKTEFNVLEKYLLVEDGYVPSATVLSWFINNMGKTTILSEGKRL